MQDQAKPVPFIAVTNKQIIGTAVIGILVGLLVWGISYVVAEYVFRAMFCQAMITEQCMASASYARGIGMIAASVAGVFALVKLQVFRPLLVGLGALASLWGLSALVATLPMGLAILFHGALFMVAYLAFMWLTRLRSFGMAMILIVVFVVAVRFALNS